MTTHGRPHLGAHAVDLNRLYATQRILGVLGVGWATVAGIFLVLGGGRQLTYPSWQPLLEFAHWSTGTPIDECYRVVGVILLLGGAFGTLGLMLTCRWLSLASCITCLVWCATVAGFLGMSNVNVAGGGNFLSVAVVFIGLVYLVRFFLLVKTPEPGRSVRLYDRG